MFRSFVRMLGLANETARTSKVGGFSPRLETLDGRELPSTMTFAAGFDATPAAVRSVGVSGGVDNFGGLAGGVLAGGGSAATLSTGGNVIEGGASGGVNGDRRGMISLDGGSPGGVLGDRAGMVSLDGGASGGVLGDRAETVSVDGGASGGVLGDRAGKVSLPETVEMSRARSAGEEIPQ